MGSFFEDTMTGLMQAVCIEKGCIPMTEIEGMPATTYRFAENKDESIMLANQARMENL